MAKWEWDIPKIGVWGPKEKIPVPEKVFRLRESGTTVTKISFEENHRTEAIPAYPAIIAMPFFYSISEGVALGAIFCAVLDPAAGEGEKIAPLRYGCCSC